MDQLIAEYKTLEAELFASQNKSHDIALRMQALAEKIMRSSD